MTLEHKHRISGLCPYCGGDGDDYHDPTCGLYTPTPFAAAAEPVAQQPPPSREHALDELAAIGQEMGEYAAQQPEAPTLADDLVRRLRSWNGAVAPRTDPPGHEDVFWTTDAAEAAARIDSDAKRIRALEAAGDALAERGRELRDERDGYRERERAAQALLALIRHTPSECLGDHPKWIQAIDEILATPDSAASPTGGEG